MNITRHNYEEYFLLYLDNELTIAQRKAVEAFVEENPDLRPELQLLQQSVFPADDGIVFGNKESLLKASAGPNPVNATNCEEYFVLYADDELTNEQKDQVEQFVYRHPQYQASFELFQQVRLMPDTAIAYPDKYALYRQEEDDKAPVVRMRWWRMAAAAAVLLVAGGMSWFLLSQESEPGPTGPVLAGNDTPATALPAPFVNDKAPANSIADADQKKATPAVSVPAPDQAQGLAATTPKQASKTDRKAASVVTVPVQHNDQQHLAVNNDNDTKNNITAPRNNDLASNVPQERDVALKPQELSRTATVDQTHRQSIAGAVNSNDMAALTRMPGNIEAAALANESMEEEEDMITDNKKNRMRGFFRKVTRVFDKATNGDTDHERSSIRIASFEFALK